MQIFLASRAKFFFKMHKTTQNWNSKFASHKPVFCMQINSIFVCSFEESAVWLKRYLFMVECARNAIKIKILFFTVKDDAKIDTTK